MNISLDRIISFFPTPGGSLQTEYDNQFVYRAFFTDKVGAVVDHPLSKLIAAELDAYFNNPKHCFHLPLQAQGTAHQQKVWDALLMIPPGQALSYGELAKKIQSSPRAVGQACKRNPIALFIPCHRVVGKDNLGGFMGSPAAMSYKKSLLTHENYIFKPV